MERSTNRQGAKNAKERVEGSGNRQGRQERQGTGRDRWPTAKTPGDGWDGSQPPRTPRAPRGRAGWTGNRQGVRAASDIARAGHRPTRGGGAGPRPTRGKAGSGRRGARRIRRGPVSHLGPRGGAQGERAAAVSTGVPGPGGQGHGVRPPGVYQYGTPSIPYWEGFVKRDRLLTFPLARRTMGLGRPPLCATGVAGLRCPRGETGCPSERDLPKSM
jgi:hypothetical protein